MNRPRNVIPPIYALLILLGFLISPAVGVGVIIVGGAASGVLWSMASRHTAAPAVGRDRSERAAERAGRRGR